MKSPILILFYVISSFTLNAQHGEIREISKSSANNLQYVDLNSDGNLDLVSLTFEELAYFLGDGLNNYSMKISIADSLGTTSNFEIGDYDLNGYLDIAVISDAKFKFFLNSNLVFTEEDKYIFSSDFQNSNMVQIDVDNDGYLDFLTSHRDYSNGFLQEKMYFHKNENANLNESEFLYYDYFSGLVKVEDLNSDGFDDIVFEFDGGTSNDLVATMKNVNGTLSVSSVFHGKYPFDFENFALKDINLDGVKDIVIAFNNDYNYLSWFEVQDFPNEFVIHVEDFSTVNINVPIRENGTLHLEDVDLDGNSDLILKGTTSISWYKVEDPSNFVFQSNLVTGLSNISKLSTFDINEDSSFDFQYFNNKSWIHLLNDGSNNFTNQKEITYNSATPIQVKIADIDNDGLKDVIYSTNTLGDLVWQKNLGNDEFSNQIVILRAYNDLNNYDLADLDNDGDFDLILSGIMYINGITYTDKLISYFNNGDGTFGQVVLIDNIKAKEIKFGDMNQDGYTDIFTISFPNSMQITQVNYYKNNAATNFTKTTVNSNGNTKSNLIISDLSNDGLLDISIINVEMPANSGRILLFQNLGSTFSSGVQVRGKPKQFFQNIQGDFDGDTDIDIVTINTFLVNGNTAYSSYMMLHKNNGSGQFLDSSLIDTNFVHFYYSNLESNFTVVDYDFDGDSDFFHLIYNDFYYFENIGTSTIAARKQFLPSYKRIGNLAVNRLSDTEKSSIIFPAEFDQKIMQFKEKTAGENPDLSLSSLQICPNTDFQVLVSNATNLNDNLHWALYQNLNDLTPLQTSLSGVFNLNIAQSSRYYVRAEGGTFLTGIFDSIDVNLEQNLSLPTISSHSENDSSITFFYNSTSNLGEAWEISIDNGLSWSNQVLSMDSTVFSGLEPNTCLNLLLREVYSGGTCVNNEAASLSDCSLCNLNTSIDTVFACFGSTYTYPDGQVLTFVDSIQSHVSVLQNVQSCDSLATVVVVAYQIPSAHIVDTVCYGSAYYFANGYIENEIFDTFNYSFTTISNLGCDSIVNYTIYTHSPNYHDFYDFSCSGVDYTFPDGTTYFVENSPIIHEVSFIDVNGCDSVLRYHLDVLPLIEKYDTVFACVNHPYYFQDGYFIDNVQSDQNYSYTINYDDVCDTTYFMFLSAIPAIFNSYVDTICEGTSINFGTQTISESGVYTETFQSFNSCDSIVTLEMFLFPSPDLSLNRIVLDSSCVESLNLIEIDGSTTGNLMITGQITDNINNVSFPYILDSLAEGSYVFTLEDLNFNCSSIPLEVNISDENFINVGLNSISEICDSVENYVFNQGYPIGGSYFFNGFETSILNQDVAIYGLNYLTYYYLDTNSMCNDSASITFNYINCNSGGVNDFEISLIKIFPNPSQGIVEIELPNTQNQFITYTLESILGQKLIYERNVVSENFKLDLQEFSEGIYLLNLYQNHKLLETYRIIKE